MRYKKVIIIFCVSVVVLVGGCRFVDEAVPLEYEAAGRAGARITETDKQMQERFSEDTEGANAIERAIQWSQRYEELSAKTEQLREKNSALLIENNELKNQMAKLKNELDKTNWELSEANSFLQDMQLELTNWKGDVLGFRDEMRAAQSAQLQALRKIMKILGAEVVEADEQLPPQGQAEKE